ncbi:hypothetical protein [Tenacibaculum amylolyticum]|uniref:hypothetical protein n=1 Tax=Tenacibaculum amylolyticum TaxID=104269 RepID=UPI0038B5FFAE
MFFTIGIIFTVIEKNKAKKELSKGRLLEVYDEIEIVNRELGKTSYWLGEIKIYDDYILLRNKFKYEIIVRSRNLEGKFKFKVIFTECLIDGRKLIIKGVKHRLIGKSNITIQLKFDNEIQTKKVYSLLRD